MALLLAAFVVFPESDLAVSSLFYRPDGGFYLRHHPILEALTWSARYGAYTLAFGFLTLAVGCLVAKRAILGQTARVWAFLLFALLVGPGLVANVIFKDNWGRARPRQTEVFGGVAPFTPALLPASNCARNCSFVSGDGSFGFFLPCLAVLAPPRARRRAFWSLLAFGSLFGIGRIISGAHFISDVVYAACLTMATNTLSYRLFFRRCNRTEIPSKRS